MKRLKSFIFMLFMLFIFVSFSWGANKYVYHGAAGGGTGADWANAYTTIAAGLTNVGAGEIIYIASDHSEEFAADQTLASTNGIAINPVTIISTKRTNDTYETMVTNGSGKIDTKTSGVYDIVLAGWDVWIGSKFMATEITIAGANDIDTKLIDCRLEVDTLLFMGPKYSGNTDTTAILENVDIVQGASGQIMTYGALLWRGGTYSWAGAGAISTNLLFPQKATRVLIEGIDFQNGDSGDFLVGSTNIVGNILFKRCKIPAAIEYMNSGPNSRGAKICFHSVDDGNYIYKFLEYYFEGKVQEDTSIYRTATYDGTNEYSVKMESDINAKEFVKPLRFKLADKWCSANPTFTVELLTDNVTLQNDEFWIEIEYPDATTGALGKIDKTSKSTTILTPPANLIVSTTAWTEAFATEKKQKVTEIISGGQAGVHTIWVNLAKPSTTVYVCPKVTVE